MASQSRTSKNPPKKRANTSASDAPSETSTAPSRGGGRRAPQRQPSVTAASQGRLEIDAGTATIEPVPDDPRTELANALMTMSTVEGLESLQGHVQYRTQLDMARISRVERLFDEILAGVEKQLTVAGGEGNSRDTLQTLVVVRKSTTDTAQQLRAVRASLSQLWAQYANVSRMYCSNHANLLGHLRTERIFNANHATGPALLSTPQRQQQATPTTTNKKASGTGGDDTDSSSAGSDAESSCSEDVFSDASSSSSVSSSASTSSVRSNSSSSSSSRLVPDSKFVM